MKLPKVDRALQHVILATDIVWIVASLSIAKIPRFTSSAPRQALWSLLHDPAVIAMSALWVALYFRKDLSGFRQGWYAATLVAQIVVAVGYLLLALCAPAFILSQHYSRISLLYLAVLLTAGFVGIRYIAHFVVTSHRNRTRRVIIVGSGRMVRELAKKITRHPELRMEIAGILLPWDSERSEDYSSLGSDAVTLRTLGILDRLQHEQADELILVEPLPPGSETEQLLSNCREAGLKVHVVPQQYELYLSKARLMEIEDVPLLSLEEHTLPSLNIQLKRVLDIIGATVLLLLASPLLMASLLFLRYSKGQALRKEVRCGRDGHAFWMYRLNVEREHGNLHGLEHFLLQFSLTELPQLFNVLKGEMSLVGPRPEAPERVKHYSMWQRQRLNVRPGLTGLAQVHGFREQHSSEEKAHFDLQYIFHWSLYLDLSLILQTGWTLVQRIIREHRMVLPSLLNSMPNVNLEIRSICNADSAQSGTD